MRILGIETSCDETAAAVIETGEGDKKVELISNVVASSLYLHAKTGGIIPEVAAREQVKYIIPVIQQALEGASIRHSGNSERSVEASRISHGDRRFWASQNDNSDIDVIAVTYGPGLIGSLLVGVETAKTLSYVWQKPIIPVNHLIGHIYANFVGGNPKSEIRNPKLDARRYELNADIKFPALALIVSGGHTDLVLLKGHQKIKWLGGTRDDAAGEAFDKIGRLLGLPYPGGPAIENAAKNGNPKSFNFPRPMIDSNDFDFSFSGLKTAVSRHVILTLSLSKGKNPRDPSSRLRRTQDDIILSNFCASIQQAIIDVLVAKTLKAAQKYKVKSILLGGGVAANQKLRDQFKVQSSKFKVKLFAPSKQLCTDNAAMIAAAAFFNYKEVPWQKIKADPELYFN